MIELPKPKTQLQIVKRSIARHKSRRRRWNVMMLKASDPHFLRHAECMVNYHTKRIHKLKRRAAQIRMELGIYD